MTKKKILVVAPSSYPINGPEAMVNAKHILLLCKMGYSVDLICRGVRKQNNIYPVKEELPYFYKDLHSIVTIVVNTEWNLRTLFHHIAAYLKCGYVYKASDWSLDAIAYCEKMLNISDYDYVLTKDYPSEIVGVYLAKKYGIKWIPTWNDPYMWKKYPAPYGEGPHYKESILRKHLIRDIGRYSFINIFPSERLKKYMLTYMENMKESNCVIMPHILLNCSLQENLIQNKALRIIHAGSIGRERNPEKFLLALKKLLDKFPQYQIEVNFLGVVQRTSSQEIIALVDSLGLTNIVKFCAPVPYEKSLDVVREFDVCLVIEAACQEGIFLPSKVVDYLQNEKRIFAISPLNGTLSDLYSKGVIDYFADVSDENAIYNELLTIYGDFIARKSKEKKDLSDFDFNNIILLHKEKILL